MQSTAAQASVDDVMKMYESIGTLSSRYYEIIPHEEYSHYSIPPLDSKELIGSKIKVHVTKKKEERINLEYACA